jgi:hypothetical protein
MMDTFDHHKSLQREFAQQLGYCNKGEIPASLVRQIAEFCDAHPNDTMTTYYASSLINKFYRRRTTERWARLINAMEAHLKNKRFLIDIFLGYSLREPQLARCGVFSAALIWRAIDDFAAGYHKANLIGSYADIFTGDIVRSAYESALAMTGVFKTRALGGICAALDPESKAAVVAFLQREFQANPSEAAYQLSRVFRDLDKQARSEVVSTYLGRADYPEYVIAYFVNHNAAFLDDEDAKRLAARIRQFNSDYYRNRCLLKLSKHLSDAEIDRLYRSFMKSFTTKEPSPELLHNLYQFSAVRGDIDKDKIVDMALDKIRNFDDSKQALYEQRKYAELSFLTPHLGAQHKERAFSIAESIRGGYRRNLLSRLRHHYSGRENFCTLR